MNEKRVYGSEVAINQEKIHDFYEKRASMSNDTAVLLGGTGAVEDKNAFDRENVIPYLSHAFTVSSTKR